MLAPDVENFLVQYLSPLAPPGQVSIYMPPNPPMPFFLVNRISGGDDYVTDEAVVSIHCFNKTRSLAAQSARRMHAMMKSLMPYSPGVLMGDGFYANVDYVMVIETPAWQEYEDKQIWRYCGRYSLDFRLRAAQNP